ncbi:macrolide family glycosyltransferase [Amycolatopsis australiensis]|uniref:Glycosyltransferase, MGT family n=1 Tax=Amycolatopsis australiensis TaxID=546364 RepID=A0A1K1RV24_9PSEU|nr:macrolide family glycosyltransferase [Amycolatopsis australiensis]SFW75778.1 glycosyltransferase, MGT family [Amycolatopsis australiensis]
MSPQAGSHIAVLSYPAHGHVNPTLPVAAELVRRGHRVSYVVAGQFAAAVRETGATVLPYESHVPKSWDTVAIPEKITGDVVAEAGLAQALEGFAPLPAALGAFGDDRPDVFLYDAFGYPTGRLLARKWEIPAVLLCSTFVANERFSPYAAMAGKVPAPDPDHPALAKAAAVVGDALAEHLPGTSAAEFAEAREDTKLVFLPREFQPGGDTFDDGFAFVGPCLGDRAGGWSPPDGRPVLLIAMGSFGYHRQREFFTACLEAFAGSPWHVVMTIGRLVRAGELGPVPRNFELHPWVPQPAVLRRASAFVSHAGMGSTMESLALGVPPVVVPRTLEQEIVADRVTELGLGVRVDPAGVTAEALRAAVTGLAADATARANVARMREHITGAGGAAAAADRVEARLTA